ncbi:MAG: DMT family transporter [Loktanella sp.]|jgi:drug/metabolite transporter (DMT)-like permease|nr:DMT family transporter [Loktanella sp.]
MNNTLKAALWMIGAITAFTSMAVAGRVAASNLDTFEIMLYRSLVGLAIVLSVASFAGTLGQIRRDKLPLHIMRNAAHFTGQNLWFFAITVIPLAQVFALEFTTPIWVILLSPILIGERITKIGAIAAAIGFIGILIVARPDPEAINAGLISAALCAIAFALTAIATRKLTQTETITCIMFFLTAIQACLGLIFAGFDGDIALPNAQTLPWVCLIGVAGLTAHFCMTKALSIAPASVVMPIDFARLPIIAVVGIMLYDEPVDALIFLGGALIFGANYLNIRFGQAKAAR